jgi:hypothetical protein
MRAIMILAAAHIVARLAGVGAGQRCRHRCRRRPVHDVVVGGVVAIVVGGVVVIVVVVVVVVYQHVFVLLLLLVKYLNVVVVFVDMFKRMLGLKHCCVVVGSFLVTLFVWFYELIVTVKLLLSLYIVSHSSLVGVIVLQLVQTVIAVVGDRSVVDAILVAFVSVCVVVVVVIAAASLQLVVIAIVRFDGGAIELRVVVVVVGGGGGDFAIVVCVGGIVVHIIVLIVVVLIVVVVRRFVAERAVVDVESNDSELSS